MKSFTDLDLRFIGRRKAPLILQTELAECGLACLAMLAGFHGLEVDLTYLRRKWAVSVKGMALSQIMEMARHLNLTPRALRLELESLSQLDLPCVLHWNMDHFVVLERVTSRGLSIVDPAIGRRFVEFDEADRNFTGVALELTPAEGFRKERRKSDLRLRDLLRGTSGLGGALAQILGFSLAIQVFALALPFYSQIVIDQVVVSGDTGLLNLLLIAFFAIVVVQTAVTAFRAWVIVYLGMKIQHIWSSKLFYHLIRLPMKYFYSRHVGDVQSRYGSLGELQKLITTQVVESLVDGLMTVTTIVVLYFYSPALATLVVGSAVLYLLVRLALFPSLRMRAQEALIAEAGKNSYFLETVRGLQTIKSFGMEHRRDSIFQNRIAETINADVRVFRLGIIEAIARQFLFAGQFIIIVWLAARSILDGQMTVGMMVAFLAYRMQFSDRAASLIDRYFEFRVARVHLDRIADIVESEPEQGLLGGQTAIARQRPVIRTLHARGIWFRYSDTDPYLFRGIDLHIRAGEHVVLTGPSGLGKTTLLKILMGLLRPERGEVLVNGQPVEDFGIQQYREMTASVMQDDALLAGTLVENISFFDPLVDTQRVARCAAIAEIDNEIAAMPMQYFTLVGDMGAALSGGQKQRVLLARAVYKQPVFLFLDEASSHLDADNEERIIENLRGLNLTMVSAAHRAESIRQANREIPIETLVTVADG